MSDSPEPLVPAIPEESRLVREAARLLAEPDRLERRVLERIAREPARYRDLKDLLEGRRDNNLTVALERLQDGGLVERQVDVSKRPAVQTYTLTAYGGWALHAMARMRHAAGVARLRRWHPPKAQAAAREHVTIFTFGPSPGNVAARLLDRLNERDFSCETIASRRLKDRSSETLIDRLHEGDFAFIILPSEIARGDWNEFQELVTHLGEHTSDWSRHCFLVHQDAPLANLFSAAAAGSAPPMLRMVLWSTEAAAEAAGVRVAEAYLRAPGPRVPPYAPRNYGEKGRLR